MLIPQASFIIYLFSPFIYRMNKQHLQLSAIFFYLVVFVNASGWMACPELSPALRLPCKCQMEQISVNGQSTSVGMDCDHIVFTSDTPQIPLGAPITTFSQRYSGQQSLPTQVLRSEIYYDDLGVAEKCGKKREKSNIDSFSL
jgi:hypothetical protein